MLVRNGLTAYLLSTALVAVGVLLGVHLLKPSVGSHSIRHVPPSGDVYVDAMTRWDGQWLLQIATEGYTYDPYSQSSVALYPLYPCLVAMASRMASLPADVTGLLVSHAALIAALTLLMTYARESCGTRGRDPQPSPLPRGVGTAGGTDCACYAVLACALFPPHSSCTWSIPNRFFSSSACSHSSQCSANGR